MVDTAQFPTTDELKKINPFSRRPVAQGRHYLKPLRKQLLLAKDFPADDTWLRVTKFVQLVAVFRGQDRLRRVYTELCKSIDPIQLTQIMARTLSNMRAFETALEIFQPHLERHPNDLGLQLAYAQQLFISGQPDAALTILKAHIDHPDLEAVARYNICAILTEAGDFEFLKSKNLGGPTPAFEFSADPHQNTTKTFCVSLDRDYQRMHTTRKFLDADGSLIVQSGVLGASLPDILTNSLVRGNRTSITPSEIGCALSHVRVWERVAQTCDENEYVLVTEDDTRFMFGPKVGLTETVDLARAAAAELVFVNTWACRDAVEAGADMPKVEAITAPHIVKGDETGRQNRPGWGACGYLVTGRMAKKLVDAWAEVGIIGAIDWQMNLMCFETLKDWQRRPARRNVFDALRDRGQWPIIDGYITNFPIIAPRDYGFSTINALV